MAVLSRKKAIQSMMSHGFALAIVFATVVWIAEWAVGRATSAPVLVSRSASKCGAGLAVVGFFRFPAFFPASEGNDAGVAATDGADRTRRTPSRLAKGRAVD
jgi:hypothetical protein